MTDVTDGTDRQTDTDRMLQKEVLNQEIYTEGRNISIDYVQCSYLDICIVHHKNITDKY